MKKEIIYKAYRYLIITFIVLLPFYVLPERYSLPFIGGNLSVIPLGMSLLILLYEYFKYGFSLEIKIKRFIFIYFGWQLICLIVGLCCYEFNHMLTINQIPRLENINNYLVTKGIIINELFAVKTWLFLRFSKGIFLTNSGIFYVAYLIYHIYINNSEKGIKDVIFAIVVLFSILGCYSFIELSWLYFKVSWASEILKVVNPYLYDVAKGHGWWPPLLWKGQLRSILGEPSHFSVLAIFSLPLLWSLFLKDNVKYLLPISYVNLMIFATNARTAVIAVFVEIVVLFMFNIIVKDKDFFKKSMIILFCFVLSFGVNLMLLTGVNSKVSNKNVNKIAQNVNSKVSNKNVNKIAQSVNKYFEKNITSVTKTNVRSNNARLIHLMASINTIKENPVFGVGEGLHSAYIDRNLPKGASKNREVRNWRKYMHEKGVIKAGYPGLNSYTYIGVKTGILGLGIYLLPFCYVLYCFLLKYRSMLKNDLKVVFLLTSLLGLLVTRMATSQFSVCDGVILGLLFCKIYELQRKGNDDVTDKA